MTKRIAATLITIVLSCITFASLLLAEGGGAPFHITLHDPPAHQVGVALDANVQAAFDDDVNAGTATNDTFVVHGHLGGLASGSFSYHAASRTVTLDPDRAFHAGEVLRVSATSGISSSGGSPLTPYGWQFTAGPVLDRGFAGFGDISALLIAASFGSAAWGDYDNDSDLDILLAGFTGTDPASNVYRNDGGGVFTDIGAELTEVSGGSAAWGDYDNDGDLDILLTGSTGSDKVSKIYRNDGSDIFVAMSTGLAPVSNSSAAWGDYDNDGDLDILLAGWSDVDLVSKVYRNDGGGAFTDIAAALTGVEGGSVAWGDYDNDGDLDILLTGERRVTHLSKVYRNDGGAFTDIGAGLTGVSWGSVAWGDVDNDGDLDILLTGLAADSTPVSKIYRNDGASGFTEIGAGLTGVHNSSVAWGDYDNDDDLDILLTGSSAGGPASKVYRNNSRPKLGSVAPASGGGPAGVTTYFTTTWSDPDGWENLKQCYFHIGDSPSLVGNVTLLYNAAKNRLWLLDDTGTAWQGGCTPGYAQFFSNSQVGVDCLDTLVQSGGDTLGVRWALQFYPGFEGSKKLGLKCKDRDKAKAKGKWKGTWTIEQEVASLW